MNNPLDAVVSSVTAGDHELALAAKRGDAQVFEILFERYQPKIFAIALRFTQVREDAEDIVQETFQKAFLHLHQFEGKSSFLTWLTRIAINEALMLLRKGRALREVLLNNSSEDETPVSGIKTANPAPDPEANYLKQESAELLRAAIGKLRARLRTAIELRELAELSTQQTAQLMGISVEAVKARVFAGRRKLRTSLRRLGISPKHVQRMAVTA